MATDLPPPADPALALLAAAAEDEVYATLLARAPELAEEFAGQIPRAKADIMRRLGTAAAQEGIDLSELPHDFQKSVANCVTNYALALTGAAHRETELRRDAGASGVGSVLDWAREQRRLDPAWSALAFFEQWVIDGHPLHPGAKIRIGMTPQDVIRTCPEWGNVVELAVVALARSHAREHPSGGAEPGSLTAILRAEHPAVDAALRNEVDDPESVVLLPVHPWQAAEVLPRRFSTELAAGTVRLLTSVTIPARPLVSYRTMAPLPTAATRYPSHLKTALSVQLTNAARGVSPQAVASGPEISGLMDRILARENHFDGKLDVLRERAGAHFVSDVGDRPTPGASAGDALTRSAALSALVRENPEASSRPDEFLLPIGALWAKSPLGDRPIVAELLDEVRRDSPGLSPAEAGVRFMAEYARVCLPPLLTLLSRYGVALEAHGENTLLAVSGGLPRRCHLRDFGGIRIDRERLARQGLRCDLAAGSPIATANAGALRQKLYFALFVNDATTLVTCLAQVTGLPAARLWEPVRLIARATFEHLHRTEPRPEVVRADSAALLELPWERKALLTMWLQRAVTDYTFVPATNPLAA